MEDVTMSRAVPVGINDSGQVPDQFQKDSPQLGRYTQQGEMVPLSQPTPAQLQQELAQMQQQITHLQHQLQRPFLQPQHPQTQQLQQQALSPQLPASPQYPHLVPRGPYSHLQNQQVPLSPQHPQINFTHDESMNRNNTSNHHHQQFLQPPLPQYAQHQPMQHIQQQQQSHTTQQQYQPQHQQHQPQQTGEQIVRRDAMMAYLMDSLNQGIHIGHYGCLVFAMVAHHFMSENEVIEYLLKDPSMDPTQAQSLYQQVQSRDYNPPRREKILEWQSHQTFPLIPDPSNQDFGNVYKDLTFPAHVYEHIASYYHHS